MKPLNGASARGSFFHLLADRNEENPWRGQTGNVYRE
jgi:hypothetical protein